MSDALSQLHRESPVRTSSQSGKAGQVEAEKKAYKAFETRGKPSPSLEIRCVRSPLQIPQSRYLMDVICSADGGDEGFTLLYSFMAVQVRGRNLKEVRRAIQHDQCEWIQELDEHTSLPPSQAEPVITSVQFVTGEKLDTLLSSYEKGTEVGCTELPSRQMH